MPEQRIIRVNAKVHTPRSKQQKKMCLSATKPILGAGLVCMLLTIFDMRSAHLYLQSGLSVETSYDGRIDVRSGGEEKTSSSVVQHINSGPSIRIEESIPSPPEVQFHVIFSTGCSTKQDWQSYTFFFHAMKSGQLGDVTRIASGCNKEDGEKMKELHRSQIEIMSSNFKLHLTPEYAKIKPDVNFKYFNKPFGVLHWMENVLGYPNNTQHDDSIIILFDPDHIILRPLTNNFTHSIEDWLPHPSRRGKHPPNVLKVEHGFPFAQQYGYSMQWLVKTNISGIASPNELPSPVEKLSLEEAGQNYPAGPPYLSTARDMYTIVLKWTEFVPHVHTQYPHLLAEMFGYSLAAAHLNLPHQLSRSFMASNVEIENSEAWKVLIDGTPPADVCENIPQDHLPHVLHYCQRYSLGKWFISKYDMPEHFLSCESPLLNMPPGNVAELYDYSVTPARSGWKRTALNVKSIKRNAFMLCHLIRAFNDAAAYFKEQNCFVSNTSHTLFLL